MSVKCQASVRQEFLRISYVCLPGAPETHNKKVIIKGFGHHSRLDLSTDTALSRTSSEGSGHVKRRWTCEA
jgi:hypothetical protein